MLFEPLVVLAVDALKLLEEFGLVTQLNALRDLAVAGTCQVHRVLPFSTETIAFVGLWDMGLELVQRDRVMVVETMKALMRLVMAHASDLLH